MHTAGSTTLTDSPVTPSTPPEAVILVKPAPTRLLSIDALRGFDMFWIIGAEETVRAWLRYSQLRAGKSVNDTSTWQMMLHKQLEHCDWEGFRFYDLIFPLFLFIIGVVIPVSLGKIKAAGESQGAMLRRIGRRVLLIVALGFLYNDVLLFNFHELRFASVLQRLGICYGLAALAVVYLRARSIAWLTVALLVGYYFLLLFVPAPGGAAGDITKEKNVAGYLDRLVIVETLGCKIYQQYYGYGDNEGILSTIPSVATALMGVLAGFWLMSQRTHFQKFLGLFWAGLVLLAFAAAWSGFFTDMSNLHDRLGVFPVIKNLWTSTYALWAGGWSLIALALFFGIIDGLGWRFWCWPFVFIGANAITIYLIEHFISFAPEAGQEVILTGDNLPLGTRIFGGIGNVIGHWLHPLHAGDPAQKLLYTTILFAIIFTGALVLKWLIVWFLYRKKIFLRA